MLEMIKTLTEELIENAKLASIDSASEKFEKLYAKIYSYIAPSNEE